MATMTWAERGIKVAQQQTVTATETEQRAIIAARFVATQAHGKRLRDVAIGLAQTQGWGYGYALRSLDLAMQAKMVGYLECSEVGCRGARNGRQSVMLHQHIGAV